MKWLTIAASLAIACVPVTRAAQSSSAQSAASSATPASTAAKRPTHKHKHYAKRQPPGQKAPLADRISEIQSALAREGYYKAGPTGKLDSNTVAALEKFQSDNGLDANGKLDAPTLQKLGLGSDIAGVAAPKPVVPSCCSATSNSTTSSSTPSGSCCSMSAAAPRQSTPSSSLSNGAGGDGAVPSDPKPDQK